MQEQELREVYQRFMDQNAWAFGSSHFEVAYHALAAAMHCAHELRALDLLSAVQSLAEQQRQWIDKHTPGHKLSSQSAKTRSGKSIFDSLAGEAKTLLLGLKVDEQAERLRQLNEKGGPAGRVT